MALLKKINPNWFPSEKKDLQVGEIFDFPGEYTQLLKGRDAVLVDENGNELPMPGTVFTCAICFEGTESLQEYTEHVLGHIPTPAPVIEQPTAEEQAVVDEIKEKRLANIKKAQEARKAKLAARKAKNG